MKSLFCLLIVFIGFSLQQDNFYKLNGDTYTMNMFIDWEPSTTEKLMGKKYERKMRGYDVTWTSRINMSEDCSIEIQEYKKCRDYSLICSEDSLIYAQSDIFASVTWGYDDVSYRTVELVGVPHRHSETGKLDILREKKWYKRGKNNLYVISFGSTDEQTYLKWLPKIKRLINSLKEK